METAPPRAEATPLDRGLRRLVRGRRRPPPPCVRTRGAPSARAGLASACAANLRPRCALPGCSGLRGPACRRRGGGADGARPGPRLGDRRACTRRARSWCSARLNPARVSAGLARSRIGRRRPTSRAQLEEAAAASIGGQALLGGAPDRRGRRRSALSSACAVFLPTLARCARPLGHVLAASLVSCTDLRPDDAG